MVNYSTNLSTKCTITIAHCTQRKTTWYDIGNPGFGLAGLEIEIEQINDICYYL